MRLPVLRSLAVPRLRSRWWILSWAGVVLGVGVAARLLLALQPNGNYDPQSYGIVADILARGGNVYAETTRYNYAPPWFLTLGALSTLGPVEILSRVLLTGVDVVTAGLLATRSRTAAALFLLNPVSIWVTGYHGQFDNAAIALMLAAMFSRSPWLAAAGVLVKQSTALAPLFVLRGSYPRRLLILVGIAALFAVSLLPWATSPEAIAGMAHNVIAYGAGSGPAGGNDLGTSVMRLVLLGGIVALAARRYSNGLLVWGLATVAIAPLTGPQAWVYPIAAGSLVGGPWLFAYSLAATLAIMGHPDAAGMGWNSGWLVSAIAALWLWRVARA